MSSDNVKKPSFVMKPPALPSTGAALFPLRSVKGERSLNDRVEDMLLKMWDDKKYRALTDAVWDSQSIEGSCAIDNTMAAKMLRDRALAEGSTLGQEKLDTLVKSTGVVLRRYNQSRKQRRELVAGDTVVGAGAGGQKEVKED